MSAVPSVFQLAQARKYNTYEIDATMLRVEHDCKIPSFRKRASKYTPIFEKLKMGSAIVCEPNEAPRIACRLREWLESNNKPAKVKQLSRCPDGMGRVWMVEN